MKFLDLKQWLSDHSVKVETKGPEIVFTHPGGKTSVLLSREAQSGPTIPIDITPLASFYAEYSGASIGKSHFVIGTNVIGGLSISHGFVLNDISQMSQRASSLGVETGTGEQVFMAGAAWMFIYTLSQSAGLIILREYDRDFHTSRVIEDLREPFDSWWEAVEADL
jgi:hypothetical protein